MTSQRGFKRVPGGRQGRGGRTSQARAKAAQCHTACWLQPATQQHNLLAGENGSRGDCFMVHIPFISSSLGKLLIILEDADPTSPLLGILPCHMLHTPLTNVIVICVVRSPTWNLSVFWESELFDAPVGQAGLLEMCLYKELSTILGENSTWEKKSQG